MELVLIAVLFVFPLLFVAGLVARGLVNERRDRRAGAGGSSGAWWLRAGSSRGSGSSHGGCSGGGGFGGGGCGGGCGG